MVHDHHLQLGSHPPLFHNFWHFNVKVAAAHHPVIQKEVDELLAEGVIEPSFVGGVSVPVCLLFLNILLALDPYLSLRSLVIIFIYLLLGCLLSDMSGSLLSMVIVFSQWNSRMFVCIFLLLSIIVILTFFFWCNTPYQWKVLPFGWLQSLGFSQPSLNLSCSFAMARVSVLLSIWMTSWFWFTLSRQVRGCIHFVLFID